MVVVGSNKAMMIVVVIEWVTWWRYGSGVGGRMGNRGGWWL